MMKHLSHHPYLCHLIVVMAVLYSMPIAEARMPQPQTTHWVRNISMNDGLSHNYVDDIFRDSMGFIWIATSGSLSRYDGYEFVDFDTNTLQRNIKSTHVRKVTEDRFNRLWVASDGGIDIIDLDNLVTIDPSTLILNADEETAALFNETSHNPSGYITTDNNGNIWLRNMNDVVFIDLDYNGNVRDVISFPHNSGTVVTTSAIKPVFDSDKGVWTSIGGKVCHLYEDNGNILSETLTGLPLFPHDVYVSDYIEYHGYLWIATDRGLYRYDRTHDVCIEFHNGNDEGALTQDFVTSLALTDEGDLIAGTLNGFNIFNHFDDRFEQVHTSDIGSYCGGMGNNFINCLLANGEDLWIGTEGCGIDLVSPRLIFSEMISHDRNDIRSLSPNPVNAIIEDSEGTLWVGTVEGGLNRSFSKALGFDHYTVATGTLPHNSVSALAADRDGNLWVGTWGGGINVVDRKNPLEVKMWLNRAPDTDENLFYIGTLQYDPVNNMMWIGANVGLYVYDIENGGLRQPFKGAEKMLGGVASILTPDGKLWIGGSDGLFIVNLKSKPGEKDFLFERKEYKLDNPETKVKEKITALAQGADGSIWIGTNGNGVYKRTLDNGKERFVNINSTDGLPSNMIHGIAEDLQGYLWIATYHGLACMTPKGEILNFGKYNGLDTEQFYWNATCRLVNGDILFGSVDGMLMVKGLGGKISDETFPVVFTSITTGNEKHYLGNGHSREIPESEKGVEINFSSLDYVGGLHGRYLYRLNGFDSEWKELPQGRHSVTYTNLPPGGYRLEVKYVSPGQLATEAPISEFNLKVIPYFYKRWWFILLAAAILGCVIWLLYRWRVHSLTQQRNALKDAVSQSVKEINEQKDLIEKSASELARQNTELKESNEKISEMARAMKKMTIDRISFFTNITHEFRTPITLIIGPIERARKLSTNPKVIEQLSFVERNSKYLLSLVNQLMDFRKVESGKMEIVPNKGDFHKFITELTIPFKAFAEERDIEVRILCHFTSPVFAYDEDALRKVITNLLGNAVKFTPDNGTITMYVSLFRSGRCEQPNTLYICVSDTGCGISEEDIGQVFDRFYQGKSSIKYPLVGSSDSGIGLYLCRRIVEAYGGHISVRNNHGAGCSFRVLLSVPEEHIDNGEKASEESRMRLSSEAAPPEGSPEAPNGALSILVVEDNKDMRGFMRSILSESYNVIEAENGREALEKLLSNPVDFIISDLMMPVMDGLELARQVKGNFATSHIPILMLTAKTADESRLEGYKTGVDEYLLKPFDEEILLSRIKNILDNKRRYQSRFMENMDTGNLNISDDTADKKFIEQVMEVVRTNYQNSYFDVGDFAEAMGMSRSLLNRKLTSLVGESPNQFIRTYRLKTAYTLLTKNRTTKMMNVSEIAFEVGFNDSKYFTRCFTKEYGKSPSTMLRGD